MFLLGEEKMKLECPCDGCVPPKRTATCHSTCNEYKKYVLKNEKRKQAIFNEKSIDIFLNENEGKRLKHLKQGLKPSALHHKKHNTRGI